MKKLLSTLLLFASIYAFGQTVPQGINYQAIALDQMGQPVPGHDIVGRPIDDAEIGVRLTILENSPTGTVLYQEEHEVLTDLYGMFNLVIGQGLQVSPDPFSSIDWIGDKYLQVELSIENNGSFTLSAVQQLMSVPYAFLAENAMVAQTAIDVDDADADPTNEIQGLSLSNDTLYLTNGGFVVLPTDQVNDADDDPTNELQGLSISNDTIYLSNGGFVTLPTDQVNDADDDPTNELQVLSLNGDTVFLSNGGFIVLPSDNVNDADSDPNNEIQVLSISNDTIYLSSGGYVTLPIDQVNDADNDPNNEIQILSLANDTIYLSNGGQIYSEDVGAEYTIRSGTTGGGTGWIISLERNGVVQPDFFRVSAGAGIALSGNNSTDYAITNLSNDMDSTNEIQHLIKRNDSLFLSGSNQGVLISENSQNSVSSLSSVTSYFNLALDTIVPASNYTFTKSIVLNRDNEIWDIDAAISQSCTGGCGSIVRRLDIEFYKLDSNLNMQSFPVNAFYSKFTYSSEAYSYASTHGWQKLMSNQKIIYSNAPATHNSYGHGNVYWNLPSGTEVYIKVIVQTSSGGPFGNWNLKILRN